MSCIPFIREGKFVKSKNFTWQIRKKLNCESSNVIYMIECSIENFKQQYIGETERNVRKRILDHVGYVKNKIVSKATGFHFNLPGHSISNIQVTIIEKVKKSDIIYRKEREHFHIQKFITFYRGINRLPRSTFVDKNFLSSEATFSELLFSS